VRSAMSMVASSTPSASRDVVMGGLIGVSSRTS
jgi:hypothetical protein